MIEIYQRIKRNSAGFKVMPSYLNQLVDAGILSKMKMERDNSYLNIQLFELLMNAFNAEQTDSTREKVATY